MLTSSNSILCDSKICEMISMTLHNYLDIDDVTLNVIGYLRFLTLYDVTLDVTVYACRWRCMTAYTTWHCIAPSWRSMTWPRRLMLIDTVWHHIYYQAVNQRKNLFFEKHESHRKWFVTCMHSVTLLQTFYSMYQGVYILRHGYVLRFMHAIRCIEMHISSTMYWDVYIFYSMYWDVREVHFNHIQRNARMWSSMQINNRTWRKEKIVCIQIFIKSKI